MLLAATLCDLSTNYFDFKFVFSRQLKLTKLFRIWFIVVDVTFVEVVEMIFFLDSVSQQLKHTIIIKSFQQLRIMVSIELLIFQLHKKKCILWYYSNLNYLLL